MMKKIVPILLLLCEALMVKGQVTDIRLAGVRDSTIVSVHKSYDNVSKIHRKLFGENYRKEWAMPVKLPVIRLSEIFGGLTPVKEGGGMESKSLLLLDSEGKEWVLRSVEKTPDKLLPENMRGTFAVDWVGDEFSGQHPFSALVVPLLADAARVPHANPIIGVVAEDPALRQFSKKFANLVCLLEQREPAGRSDNTIKMERELVRSNDNRFDGELFLRARMLDLLLGDWDRHEDQWRWAVTNDGKARIYASVPRDRDQVFHVNQGVFPTIAALPWLNPVLDNFAADIPDIKWSIYKTRFMKEFPDAQITYEAWMKAANDFVKAETDEVLLAGLKCMPKENYAYRGKELYTKLRKRRDNIPAAMSAYYYFINRIVDLHATDKSEKITITGTKDRGLRVKIEKLNGLGETGSVLMDLIYHPEITKEIRLYTAAGNDRIIIDNSLSPIKLRIVDSADPKIIDVKNSVSKVQLYGPKDNTRFLGDAGRLSKHLSNDSANVMVQRTNLYNKWMPLANAAINADDGLLLGLGFKYTGYDGFRKGAYSNVQQLMLTHSFATDAFRVNYDGEWIKSVGTADITIHAQINAPNNTTNFFGRGNETKLNKFDDYHRYYRARFNTFETNPALRWHTGKTSSVSFGPSFQYYHMDPGDNNGRLISQPSMIHSYDSLTTNKDKAHVGLIGHLVSNKRDNDIYPSTGYYFDLIISGYKGLNNYSRSFAQMKTEFTYYLRTDASSNVVFSDRIGGGVSIGSPAFYQSMFLGGQGNLLGFLNNRFAGRNMIYNNLQGRLKLAKIPGYILPGQLGLTGFYDAGRVWAEDEHSTKIHQGVGGGLYFAPASLTILQLLAGHSEDGWYPYIAFNFRF
jgi:hypothetical protein